MFKLNPAVYGSVFALPSTVVDNYILLSSELQLKVLLLIARNSLTDSSASALSKILHCNERDASDALEYWVSEGVLVDDEKKNEVTPDKEVVPQKEVRRTDLAQSEEKAVADIPIVKPTMEQVIARQEEDAKLRYLFNEAQVVLGRTIGWEGQATFLIIYDHYGLPAEVILTLLEYLKSIGKTSMSDIIKLAKSWAQKEITTVDRADEYIDRMNSTKAVFEAIKEVSGIKHEKPSASQAEFMAEWTEMGFSIPVIVKAYDIMVTNTEKPSFPYVNKVLLAWRDKGYKTVSDIENGEKKDKSPAKSDKKKASYDIDKAKRQARYGEIDISKREG